MSKNFINIEIQAPARNFEFAKEAIKCGADTIFVGAPNYSMRPDFGNTLEDIKRIIEYAHKYWVKVYIAANCLLYDKNDLKNMKDMIWQFYEMQADAIIIQDMGILELDLPPIPVFLSTNAGCYSKDVCKFFEDIGVYRIILPRDMTYNEIIEISEHTNIDLEAFCYGYLCVGHSDKCYLTYTENISKGNTVEFSHRNATNFGPCTGSCVKYYDLFDADGNIIVKNDKLLSIKFLNLPDETIKLFDAGVYSYKIAGRERDMIFLKNSVANYNIIANEIVKKRKNVKRMGSGRCILGFKPDFTKSFSKGHTDFFFYGRKHELYSKNMLVGENVGCVKTFKDNSFSLLDSSCKLAQGDKLRYKNKNGEVKTLEIVSVKGQKYFCSPTEDDITGLSLFRYINSEGFKEVEKSVNYRVISVHLSFNDDGKEYTVQAKDEDNNVVLVSYKKGNHKIDLKRLKQEFYSISEECEFVIDRVRARDDIFIDNVEKLKSIIFEKLREERRENRPRIECNIQKNNIQYPKKKLSYLDNVTNELAVQFYKRHGVEDIETSIEWRSDLDGLRVFNSRYCLKYELGYCSKTNSKNVPKEPWILQNKSNGNKFRINCDCKKCEMQLLYMSDSKK